MENKYNLKKFEGRNVRLEERITITKSFSIGFPTKFYNDNEIKKFKYVTLFWDAEKKAVGMHFINDENEKSKFSINHSKKGYGGSVIARSFFRFHGIDPGAYKGRYEWEKQDVEGVGEVFILELKERDDRK